MGKNLSNGEAAGNVFAVIMSHQKKETEEKTNEEINAEHKKEDRTADEILNDYLPNIWKTGREWRAKIAKLEDDTTKMSAEENEDILNKQKSSIQDLRDRWFKLLENKLQSSANDEGAPIDMMVKQLPFHELQCVMDRLDVPFRKTSLFKKIKSQKIVSIFKGFEKNYNIYKSDLFIQKENGVSPRMILLERLRKEFIDDYAVYAACARALDRNMFELLDGLLHFGNAGKRAAWRKRCLKELKGMICPADFPRIRKELGKRNDAGKIPIYEIATQNSRNYPKTSESFKD